MKLLKQSTKVTVYVGPILSVSGATVSPVTTATAGSVDTLGIIANGTFVDLSGATFTHIKDGNYELILSASNLSATGFARVIIRDDSAAIYTWEDYEVLAANPYDSLVPGTDYLQADIIQVDGAAQDIATAATLTEVKAQTDKLNFTGTDVKATLDGEEVTTDSASRTASKADVSALASAATLQDVYNKVAPLTYNGNDVKATLDGEEVTTDAASRTASKADVSALALEASIGAISADIAAISGDIAGLNDLSAAEVEAAAVAAITSQDLPNTTELNARTLPSADYFDPSTDEVTTDAASRTASKADVSGLALEATLTAMKGAGWTDETLVSIKAAIDALNDLSAADVNAEMLDVLNVDTMPELSQGIPPAEPTPFEAFMLLYMTLRNKITQTSNEFAVYADDGTKIAKKDTSDAAGTFTQDKMASGA